MKRQSMLNLVAILFLGAGGLIALIPSMAVAPELQGLLWGGLVAWLASAGLNGTRSSSP